MPDLDVAERVLENRFLQFSSLSLSSEQRNLLEWISITYSNAVGKEIEGLIRGTTDKLVHTSTGVMDRIRQEARRQNITLPRLQNSIA